MWKNEGRAPSLRFLPCGICLTTEEKARKTLSQGKKNLSQVRKNFSQSTVHILSKHPHITKPTQTHTLQNPHLHTHTHTHTHTLQNPHLHTYTHTHTQRLHWQFEVRLLLFTVPTCLNISTTPELKF